MQLVSQFVCLKALHSWSRALQASKTTQQQLSLIYQHQLEGVYEERLVEVRKEASSQLVETRRRVLELQEELRELQEHSQRLEEQLGGGGPKGGMEFCHDIRSVF